MIYLITRPFVWLAKLVKTVVTAPFKAMRMRRDQKVRKTVKDLKKAGA